MTLTICFRKGLSVRLSLPVSPDGLLGSVSRRDFWAACTLSGQWTVGDSFSLAHSPLYTWRRSGIKLHSSQRPKSFICLFPIAQLKSDPTNKRKNPFSYATAEGPSPLRSDLLGTALHFPATTRCWLSHILESRRYTLFMLLALHCIWV